MPDETRDNQIFDNKSGLRLQAGGMKKREETIIQKASRARARCFTCAWPWHGAWLWLTLFHPDFTWEFHLGILRNLFLPGFLSCISLRPSY